MVDKRAQHIGDSFGWAASDGERSESERSGATQVQPRSIGKVVGTDSPSGH
jgi:hypothetical protein